MKKSFFDQFGKEIDKEAKNFKSHSEKTPEEFIKCKHTDAKIINGELRCKCGSAWSGGRLDILMEKLGVI